MKTTRLPYVLPLASMLIFIVSLSGYVGFRTGISNDLFGGDAVNVASHHPSSFAVNKTNVDLPAMAKDILSGRDNKSLENPHAFVYSQLSSQGRAALERFVNNFHDARSETEFLLNLDRSLLDREISWPAAFQGPPHVGEGGVQNQDMRNKNLQALAAVYPIMLPVNRVTYAFNEQGVWAGLKMLKPFALAYFTLSEPTRYSPLTNIYVISMEAFLSGHPDNVVIGIVITGILYALLALTVFLLAETIIDSIPWAIVSAFVTMAATSTIAASDTLFSLPYMFVPIVMGMAFYGYLKFKKSGSSVWLLLFSLCALIGPWFREFAAAIPFIVLACEIVLPSARRSWLVLILCLIFIGHSVYPSFFTWLLGINKGIVIGVFQQANTQSQMRASTPGNLGFLFVQFPPSFWILAAFGILWWIWNRFSPTPATHFQLPFWDIGFSLPLSPAFSWCIRITLSLAFLATVLGLIEALFVLGDSIPFLMIAWTLSWVLGMFFFVLIGLFSLRFGVLLPTYFAVTFIPFLWLNLAEVHMAFAIPPMAIMLTAWVRELFQGVSGAGLRKTKLAAAALLAMAVGDQFLNYSASLNVQKRLVEANRTIADWLVGHSTRNSLVLSNFFNYTDVYYYSGNYFDPFETVENNPLGSNRTIHHNEQMQQLLADNFKLRDIFFLQEEHDFFEWQRGYHSHKWVNNPPGTIRKLEGFPVKVYYYYLDPLKYFIPRNFVSFFGYMDWSIDYYFNNDTTPFRRVVDVTYSIFKLEDVDPNAMQKEPHPKFVAVPFLVKGGVGPMRDFNLVQFQNRFYAVPQALGGVDWGAGKVATLEGVIVGATHEEVMEKLEHVKPAFSATPILVKQSVGPKENFNLVQFKDRFYAVPHTLGSVDWSSGTVDALEGVIVGTSPEEIMEKLAHVKPIFTAIPVLIEQSVGPKENFNLVQFKDRFYAIPQALGSVDWKAAKVGALEGVIAAATPEEVMAKLKEVKPAFAPAPVMMKESVGPAGDFNLVHFQDRFYVIPQALGGVNWKSGKVDALEGVFVAATPEAVIEKLNVSKPAFASTPILMKESVGPKENFNLVQFKDRFYAIPQALGSVDWKTAKVDALKGVISAATPEEIMAKLNGAKPAFAPAPIMMNESVGPTGQFNLVHFQDRFYAVPQALGAVNWASGKVDTLEGIIIATTPEQVMAKLNETKQGLALTPMMMKESVGPTGKFNLVHFQDRFYAVPQALGTVDWASGKVDTLEGVIVAATSEQVMEKLNAAKPLVALTPILIKQAVGPEENFNLVQFKGRFYAIPQELGGVDWESGMVDTLEGVIVAATPEAVMEKLNAAKP